MTRIRFAFYLLLAVVLISSAIAQPGGYQPIQDLRDEKVLAAADYAVSSITESSGYSFAYFVANSNDAFLSKVTKGQEQVVAGMNYKLDIEILLDVETADEDESAACIGAFRATINVDLDGETTVTDFGRQLPCSPPRPGGWTPVPDFEDGEVLDAANEAVSLLYLSTDANYTFYDLVVGAELPVSSKVLYGLEQVAPEPNYKLVIELVDKADICIGVFQATIYFVVTGAGTVSEWGDELPCPELFGGYETIEDLTGDDVIYASEYAVSSLSDSTRDYSFTDFVVTDGDSITTKLLFGKQQLLFPGTNYRLYIKLLNEANDNTCAGAFQVTVYVAQNGTREVTDWGQELSCPIMPGGWWPIEDVDDEDVVALGQYVINNLYEATEDYTFLEEVLTSNCVFTPNIVFGQEQVVAGMNYWLIVEVIDCKDKCIGSVEVTVYADLDDRMSITNWGKELPCVASD